MKRPPCVSGWTPKARSSTCSNGRNRYWRRSVTSVQTARIWIQRQASGCRAVNSLQSVILTLSLSYALIGALLLIVLVYARLPWSAKAVAVVVTSAFYIASFVAVRGLLGWASVDRLPVAFKLLQARIVEPHSLEGDPGSIYLGVEALEEDNR